MSVPKFHETFLPILKVLSDGEIHKTSDLPEKILNEGYFDLSDDELSERINSGEKVYIHRVWWGTTYLKQGKFVIRPTRGMIQITQKGLDLLKNNPDKLTLDWLKEDEDYKAYVPQKVKKDKKDDEKIEDLSPEDLIDKGFDEIEESLKKELLEKLHDTNPYHFENIVLVLFNKMGYGDFEGTPKSRDGGIDGIISQDKLGVDKIYVQAKRYKEGNNVRETDIRNFLGSMSGKVSKGIFVTTSSFDRHAIERAKDSNNKVILVDGEKLVSLLIEFNIGVQVKNTYFVKEVDEDFFEIG